MPLGAGILHWMLVCCTIEEKIEEEKRLVWLETDKIASETLLNFLFFIFLLRFCYYAFN